MYVNREGIDPLETKKQEEKAKQEEAERKAQEELVQKYTFRTAGNDFFRANSERGG
ncbi:MAG: hypothetical protein LUC43_05945 [Burkholderiales bacterium]|nr:hypothetical protein [Burkholderiales bacterium]